MNIVIKVGTQAILAADGTLMKSAMKNLVRQVAKLQQAGHNVVLVSSGAVASGRKVAQDVLNRKFGATLGEKQVLASMGQHELMGAYAKLFKPYKIATAQLLLTKQDFDTRKHYLNITRLLGEVSGNKRIVAIINENDSVAVEELMFTDNDELSGIIAAQINAEKLVLLTSVNGVYNGHPDEKGAEIIPVIDPEKDSWPVVSSTKTSLGRGGMATKLGTARKMSEIGITTHIAALHEKDIILKIVKGQDIGTKILPRKKKSGIKRWIAFNEGKKNGSIRVNQPLFDILQDNKRVLSILPVGIKSCAGEFKKGDLVDISSPDGTKIGIGIARYDAPKLREYMGQKGKPAFIHYDHLHLTGGA